MSPTLRSLWTQCQEDLFCPASSEAQQTCIDYLDQITEAFGLKFTDGLTNALGERYVQEIENAYELGFTTAFRLWAEIFAPPKSPPC